MSEGDKGYKVTDRRSFTPEGDLREEAPAEKPESQPETRGSQEERAGATPMPEIDFPTFILSLASSALMQMGAAREEGEQSQVNLPLARETIDIIAMLQQKTKGNLSGEEERLLDHILYDLRLQYVAAAKR